MFDIEQTPLIEPHMRLPVPQEVNAERGMCDDSLELPIRPIRNPGRPLLHGITEFGILVQIQSPNDRPFLGLIVPLLPNLTSMPQFNVAFLPLFFVQSHPCKARLKERDRQWQSDPLNLGSTDSLVNDSLKLPSLEGQRLGIEFVR